MADLRIGVISDTHGLVRPEALAALDGCTMLIHAGDIGSPAVLETLSRHAPVHAVRGNVDRDPGLMVVPSTLDLVLGGLRIHVVHRPQDIDPVTAAAADLVVCGHTHQPCIDRVDGTLRVNPGSAGPRRFSLPVSVAVVDVREGITEPRLLTLDVPLRRAASRRGGRR